MAFCSNCGTARQENAGFCMNCGNKFEAVAAVPAPPPPAPEPVPEPIPVSIPEPVQEAAVPTLVPPPPPAPVAPPPPPPVPEPQPVQVAPPMPDWLNQPAEAPVSAPEAPPPVYAPPPAYEAPPAASQAYIMPEKAPKKKKSPVKVIVVIILGLALAAGGYFGVDFLLNNFFSGLSSTSLDYRDDDRGRDRDRSRNDEGENPSSLAVDPPTTTTAPPVTTTLPHIPTHPAVDYITIWTFSDEISNAVLRYQEMYPYSIVAKFDIHRVIVSDYDGMYEQAIEPALLAGGSGAPDLYLAEQAFALKFMQGDFSSFAATYSELGISDVEGKIRAAGLSQYAVDAGRRNGEVVGLRYQETAGCFIYRRSIALNTWGTDDPAFVGAKIGPGWDRFASAAAELNANGYAIVHGAGDIWQAAREGASQPWVVNNRLVIDPARLLFMDVAKELYDNEYVLGGYAWSDSWFRAMEGRTYPEVFGYIGPSWLLNYVIANNCGDTYGDWAVTSSPVSFSWGGAWVLGNKDLEGEKRAAVAELIEWLTLDTSETGFQYLFATGTLYDGSQLFSDMTNYWGDVTRDTVPSSVVMSKIDSSLSVLGGQNMNEYYLPAAANVRSSHWHEYDSKINVLFMDYCDMYYNGYMSKDEVITEFKYEVQDRFGLYID